MTRTSKRDRRAFTLTELIIVMGMASIVLSLAVGMIHRVMYEQKISERDNDLHRVAERFSPQLREDVHAAVNAELQPINELSKDENQDEANQNEQVLVLHQRDKSTVTYIVHEHTVERLSARENEILHRNDYRFPQEHRFQFEVEKSRVSFTGFAIPQVYLTTVNEETSSVVNESDVRRAVIKIEATVGRDYRFLSETTGENASDDMEPQE